MADKFRIVIVDDHPIIRAGVSQALNRHEGFTVTGEGETADDAVRLAEELQPDVILLDVGMPGGGIAAAQIIAHRCPSVRIVFLTVYDDAATIAAAAEAGARGYILKGVGGGELIELLIRIAGDDAVIFPEIYDDHAVSDFRSNRRERAGAAPIGRAMKSLRATRLLTGRRVPA